MPCDNSQELLTTYSNYQTKRGCVENDAPSFLSTVLLYFFLKRQTSILFFMAHFEGNHLLLSCQKATADAAATLRESTPCAIGMRTT